jgi:hypothetical protein
VQIEAQPTTSTMAEAVQAKAEARLLLEENGKLREALHDMAKYISRGDWQSLKPETRAALGEKQ